MLYRCLLPVSKYFIPRYNLLNYRILKIVKKYLAIFVCMISSLYIPSIMVFSIINITSAMRDADAFPALKREHSPIKMQIDINR
jgi:hypothetical protein